MRFAEFIKCKHQQESVAHLQSTPCLPAEVCVVALHPLELRQNHQILRPEEPDGAALDVAVAEGRQVAEDDGEPEGRVREDVVRDAVLRDVVNVEDLLHEREQDREGVHQCVRQEHDDREHLGPVPADQRDLRRNSRVNYTTTRRASALVSGID